MRIILACAVLAMLATTAWAHSWYSLKYDPVLRNSCCGGHDCAMWAIQPGEIAAEADGVRIRLSLERTRTINPYSTRPLDTVVVWDRVQPSEDGNWHLCIPALERGAPFWGVYCLFMPANG